MKGTGYMSRVVSLTLLVSFLVATNANVFPQALPGGDPNIIIVDPKNPGVSDNPIRTQASTTISIGFPNTAGTGFLWIAQVENETVVTCVKTKSIAVKRGNEPVVGFRTLDVFVITPHSIGTTRINFRLERPDGERLYSLTMPIIVDS